MIAPLYKTVCTDRSAGNKTLYRTDFTIITGQGKTGQNRYKLTIKTLVIIAVLKYNIGVGHGLQYNVYIESRL